MGCLFHRRDTPTLNPVSWTNSCATWSQKRSPQDPTHSTHRRVKNPCQCTSDLLLARNDPWCQTYGGRLQEMFRLTTFTTEGTSNSNNSLKTIWSSERWSWVSAWNTLPGLDRQVLWMANGKTFEEAEHSRGDLNTGGLVFGAWKTSGFKIWQRSPVQAIVWSMVWGQKHQSSVVFSI